MFLLNEKRIGREIGRFPVAPGIISIERVRPALGKLHAMWIFAGGSGFELDSALPLDTLGFGFPGKGLLPFDNGGDHFILADDPGDTGSVFKGPLRKILLPTFTKEHWKELLCFCLHFLLGRCGRGDAGDKEERQERSKASGFH
jgi:hypothetical protein